MSGTGGKAGDDVLPGDLTPSQRLERMIRVDHAGEMGAVRIYEGQLAVLGHKRQGPMLRHMLDQEKAHRDYFQREVGHRQVRPTVLEPFWHVAGWMLGAGTAFLGEKTAMACTVAVEEVIDEHYAEQLERLGDDEAELREKIKTFRAEEREHRDIGYAQGAEQAPGYVLLHGAIRRGTKLAIWLSERF